MDVLRNISDKFWGEKFWLPSNFTWKDIEPGYRGINHADYRHILWPIPMAALIICIRFLAEKHCFMSMGKSLGIKATKCSPPRPNKYLEMAYSKQQKLNGTDLLKLSKQLDLSEREIERWWRNRRALDKPTTLVKFCETCWRCFFYFSNFSFGLFVLWEKPYLWDVLQCTYNYPHHGVSNGVWWYYMISMGFYWSLAFTQFFDNKRKDFWQMFIHHVLALTLICLSWVCNIHRVGSLILLLHDCADIFVEAAKALNYAKRTKACDILFGIFTIVWVVTRLVFFPRLIYLCIFQTFLPFYPVYFFFNALLVGLLILHIIWTWMIFQVIAKGLKSGEVNGDVRSSSDDDEVNEDGKEITVTGEQRTLG